MELAELADVLPVDDFGSNWGELGLESARGPAEPPESAAGSSPLQDLPASASHRQNGTESPKQSRPVSTSTSAVSDASGLCRNLALLAFVYIIAHHAAVRLSTLS